MVERKLIRPALRDYRGAKKPPQEIREPQPRTVRDPDAAPPSRDGGQPFSPVRRKQAPPEQTNAENFYYIKQMTAKTPMVFIFIDGEEIRGWIEWYDKNCLKIHRNEGPNLLVYKGAIKCMYKEREA